jgi:uncharacterized RDD family membrane protein YckC
MFCSRCGLKVEEGARYCQACGQEIVSLAPPAPIATQSPSMPVPIYAGFWLRLVAYFIDGVILGVPFGLLVLILIFFLGGFGLMMHRNPIDSRDAAIFAGPLVLVFALSMIFFLALQWLYFAGMESSERQATFGKAAMSLRVTDLEGRRLSFGRATGRFFAKIVSGLVPLAIGYIMAGFTEKKQAIHDMIAGTLVLRH